jgi:tRNA(fMet)-specific endonuclease VapC
MSGPRFIFDTNAIVALLNGSSGLNDIVGSAKWIGISIINYLEFLAYTGLSPEDGALFTDFCSRIDVIGLKVEDAKLLDTTTRLRRDYRLKLPDAIIAATALTSEATLVTADDDFRRVSGLAVLNPAPK